MLWVEMGPEGSSRIKPASVETVRGQTDVSLKGTSIFNLVLKFVQTPGHVLLVQGPPGSGKTTFALEILNRLEETHKIYASSRVAPSRLRSQFPWIDEVIDAMSGRTARANWIDELHDIRRVEPDTIFNQILRLKHSKQRALLVVDSWEGAIRNTNDEGRRMLESAILSELDESMVSVVIVTEEPRHLAELGYLVDGIVTLDQSEIEGRRVRTFALNKLRGFRVPAKRGIFSLDNARFSLLPSGIRNGGNVPSPKLLEPVPHPSSSSFSLGSRDLDRVLGGSVPRGTFMLIDVDSTVSPVETRSLLNMIRGNFVNQGGSCFIMSSGAYSSDSVAESLSQVVGWEVVDQRARIIEYNPLLPPKKWRVSFTGKLSEDAKSFLHTWDEMEKVSPQRMLNIDCDKVVQVYGDNPAVPGFSELGATMRDSGALLIGVASLQTQLRDQFLRLADYHLKIKNLDDSTILYGEKPFTPVCGVYLNYEKGYPALSLKEIV